MGIADLFQSEVADAMARAPYAAFCRRVVNATDGGRLNVFERMDLAALVGLELRLTDSKTHEHHARNEQPAAKPQGYDSALLACPIPTPLARYNCTA